MFQPKFVFSGFSVDHLDEAKGFYHEALGLDVEESDMGLMINLPGGGKAYVYQKDDHQPAAYTMLNFEVDDIDSAVAALKEQHIAFEHYEGLNGDDDIARGIDAHRGPDIAWFKDPAGNILAVLQNER